jgi:hypothetical protein
VSSPAELLGKLRVGKQPLERRADDRFHGAATVGGPVAFDSCDHEVGTSARQLRQVRPDEAQPEAQVGIDDRVTRRLLARRNGVRQRPGDEPFDVDEHFERGAERVSLHAAAIRDPSVRGLAVADRAQHSLGL